MKITAKEIAAIAGGIVDGDENVVITSFSPIEGAKKGDLTFLANPKYYGFLATTDASAVLVGDDITADNFKTTLIRVKDPYATLALLMQYVERAKPHREGIENPVYLPEGFIPPKKIYIGAFTYIGNNVKIREGISIYPQCYIGNNVEIGEDTIIYPGVKIYDGCKIGNRCIIHAGAVIGSDGFGFAPNGDRFEKIPQIGNVEIEDDVEIGANTTIDRATFGSTRIGKGTKLDNLIQVAHNVEIGKGNVFAAQTGIAGSTHIGNGNYVGGQCGFAGHLRVGDNNQIGAQSGIPKDIGNGERLIGYPAIDARQFFKNQVYIRNLGEIFKKNKTN